MTAGISQPLSQWERQGWSPTQYIWSSDLTSAPPLLPLLASPSSTSEVSALWLFKLPLQFQLLQHTQIPKQSAHTLESKKIICTTIYTKSNLLPSKQSTRPFEEKAKIYLQTHPSAGAPECLLTWQPTSWQVNPWIQQAKKGEESQPNWFPTISLPQLSQAGQFKEQRKDQVLPRTSGSPLCWEPSENPWTSIWISSAADEGIKKRLELPSSPSENFTR